MSRRRKQPRQRWITLSAAERRAIDEACERPTAHGPRTSLSEYVGITLLVLVACFVAWRVFFV